MLLSSKIPITESLEIIITQTRNENFKQILKEILKGIKSGNSLVSSFGKYPKVFNELYISQLKVGEETGALAEIILEYTSYQEKFDNLRRKIIAAIRYPIFVLTIAFLTVLFMLLFLIPSFESLFRSTNFEMPGITTFLLSVSLFIKDNYLIILTTVGIITFLISTLFGNINFRETVLDKIVLKLPIISDLFVKNLLGRFSLTMGVLLKNKVPLIDSLVISRSVSSNTVFRNEINELRKRLLKGEKFSGNMKDSKIFDPAFPKLLSVGEESAEMEKVFGLLYEYYNREFERALDGFSSMLEPALILIIGVIVSIVLIAMYLPMFEIANYLGV